MLVLTRKRDESIVIDGRITIKILRVNGNRVRIGIDAPPEIRIRRSELESLAIAEASDDSRIKRSA